MYYTQQLFSINWLKKIIENSFSTHITFRFQILII